MAELLVTIGIIAVLASIAIVLFSDILPSFRHDIAGDSSAFLNKGVHHYNQTHSEIAVAADAGANDELTVLALLQTRDPALPGSPYIPAEFSAVSSSSTDVVRLNWTGKFFTIIPEGQAGTGIAVSQ